MPMDFSRQIHFFLIFKLARTINKNRINLIHGQGMRAEFHARLAGRIAGGVPYVSTVAMPVEGFDVGPLRKSIYRFFDRFSERFVDRFVVVSDALRMKLIHDHGIPPMKVVRIYNGIEIDQYSPQNNIAYRSKIRNEFGLNENHIICGAVGRLVWQKGFEYLIDAVPKILKPFPNAVIMIVGEGPLKDRLKARSERLRVQDQLIFTGFRSDIREILAAMDIFVLSSLLEGFPMIILEAMAMGKPIVATEISGVTEQIKHRESGILVPAGDSFALAKAINQLSHDRSFSEYLGLNAMHRVRDRFTTEGMITETENVYHSII